MIKKFPETQIAIVFTVICVLASLFVPRFFDFGNLTAVLTQVAPIGVIAVGMTFVITTAGIDLSVGSQVAMISILMAGAGNEPCLMMVVAAMFWGILSGATNGFLIGYARISPFITTLAMMAICKGVALFVSNTEEKRILDPSFGEIATTKFLGLPMPVWIFILFVIVGQVVLRRTIFGLRVAAIGSNQEASRFAGIDIKLIRMLVYVITGFCCGVGALLITSRLNTATPTVGDFYELDAIAAVIIGGTSLFGGRGTVIGTLFGVLIFGMITNILNLMGASPHAQRIVKGLIILTAVYLQSEQFIQVFKNRFKKRR